LRINLKGRHFDTIEVIEEAFKNSRLYGNEAFTRKRVYFEGDGDQQAQS
jgi:hypothetical protein